MRMTLDELINAMEPQARKDKALISKCVDGLTEYAAELRQKAGDAGKEQISALRRLVDELAGYWGLDAKTVDHVTAFDRKIQEVDQAVHQWTPTQEHIRLPKAAPASTDALRIENELALCFNRADINPEYMKTLIMAAAAERYAGLNDPTPAHRRALLRQKLELEPENEETLWELFESAVTHVCIGKGGEISLSQKDQKECAS